MKKVITMFAMGLVALSLVFAPSGASAVGTTTATSSIKIKMDKKSDKKISKNVDVACVATAVGKREDALLKSWQTFDDAVEATFAARKSALVSAWSLSDAKERKTAVKKALSEAKSARKAAASTLKTSKKSTWSTFKSEAKACGGAAGSEASLESEAGEKVEI